MKYSAPFLGWVGETAHTFTYEKVYELAMTLAPYYKEHSSPGQKLMIGYDTRFLAKEFAEFFSCMMAQKGIKVFLSNKVVPSSVLVVSALHKKSMGTVVFTGDDAQANVLGIRAYDAQGFALNETDLKDFVHKKKKEVNNFDVSLKKWIQKGYIEPFDSSICYENHIVENIDFDAIVPSTNRVLFNPLFGSGIYYFDRLLSEKRVRGYTTDNELIADFKGLTPAPPTFKNELYEEMLIKGIELGFIVSPDCATFEFIVGPVILTTSDLVHLLAEHIVVKSEQKTIILHELLEVQKDYLQSMGYQVQIVNQQSFYETIRTQPYALAVDHLGRFYFEFHGAPDALMAGYYLLECFNNKHVTPSAMQRKFELIGALVYDENEGGLA